MTRKRFNHRAFAQTVKTHETRDRCGSNANRCSSPKTCRGRLQLMQRHYFALYFSSLCIEWCALRARAASHARHLPNDPLIYVLSSSARGLLLFKRIPSCVHVDFNTTIVTALLIHRRNIHKKTSNNRVKNSFKMQIRTRICY